MRRFGKIFLRKHYKFNLLFILDESELSGFGDKVILLAASLLRNEKLLVEQAGDSNPEISHLTFRVAGSLGYTNLVQKQMVRDFFMGSFLRDALPTTVRV